MKCCTVVMGLVVVNIFLLRVNFDRYIRAKHINCYQNTTTEREREAGSRKKKTWERGWGVGGGV